MKFSEAGILLVNVNKWSRVKVAADHHDMELRSRLGNVRKYSMYYSVYKLSLTVRCMKMVGWLASACHTVHVCG